ncbi:MAG: phenylalanine--tRNA ligase subunit beta [Desulfobacterales bacterium]
MKVSVSWLNDYVPIEMDIPRLVDALTMVGLEVDIVADRYDYLQSVVVGFIIHITAHPNADHLKICEVDIGDRLIQVVCGAPNAEKNRYVATALPGSELPHGQIIEKSDVRGQMSEGMLCSEAELGLGPDRSGVLVLDTGYNPGTPLAGALNLSDSVLDIDLTPNRPDCLSLLGVAREIAAIQGGRVRYPNFESPGREGSRIHQLTSVTIESPEDCPRYVARLIEGVSVAPSPFWLQDRLLSVGTRPINNIVDITNFVMLETGQPLHAFDYDRLAENRIVVRRAHQGEPFTTLDEKEHRLSDRMLMICDGRKPVAVAGVMGGLNSEITGTTRRVLIESAYFSPVSIRKTSKALGLYTDASHRFERGVDPEGTVNAANRAASLMVDITRGQMVEGLIDEHPLTIKPATLALSARETNDTLGTEIDPETVRRLLKSIEFEVSMVDDDQMKVRPPSFRVDVIRPVDLTEEVARLYGYQKIPTTFPGSTPQQKLHSPELDLRKRIKLLMKGFGFTEAVNYSFMDQNAVTSLRIPEGDFRRRSVAILNPLTEEQTHMRTQLLYGLLQTTHRNLARRESNLKLFEVGKAFIEDGNDNLPEEIEMLAGLWTGVRTEQTWHQTTPPSCDYYDIKGVVEGLFTALKIEHYRFTRMPPDACCYTRPGYTAKIDVKTDEVGRVGELHPEVVDHYDLKQTAYIFEINLGALLLHIPGAVFSRALPKYPAVARDVTLIVDKNIESENILETVRRMDEKLVENVHLFDIFEGRKLPEGKKSISFRITYRSPERTLSDDEVNVLHTSIADTIIRRFNAALPA